MPELPEVETTRSGIEPHLLQQTIKSVTIRQPKLRWPVDNKLSKEATNANIDSVTRRAKYLIISTSKGHIIIHLGMSGSLRIVDTNTMPEKHDHVDFILENKQCLRYRDPRRFGAILWIKESPLQHPLIKNLGPEPLSDEFDGTYLYKKTKNKTTNIKAFIMNSHIVVGVGNIYASEALFLTNIRPTKTIKYLTKKQCTHLVDNIKAVLSNAIKHGGTTLKDFVAANGKPGYFRIHLNVYGREQESCGQCKTPIKKIKQNQRSSYYCPKCQN